MQYFQNLNIIIQTLFATIFTTFLTSLGSAIVFLFKRINKTVLDSMMALSAGIMIAASYFSLLNPAITLAENLSLNKWIILSSGFITGGLTLYITSKIFDKKLNKNNKNISKIKRCFMLFTSITVHNIPEGMVVGVAFASTLFNIGTSLTSAIILTIGIAIQNFPEGCAVSLPLRRDGMSRIKAFLFGTLSGSVEIISGIIGALLVLKIRLLLPFLMSFASGAMIYVVTEELIPESQTNKNKSLISLLTLIGFTIMMILDIALG